MAVSVFASVVGKYSWQKNRGQPKKKKQQAEINFTKTMNKFFSSSKFSLSFWRKGKGLLDSEASVIKRRISSSLVTSATPRCPRLTLGMVSRV